ncbi:protein adenylyltransferase SelO [Ureibacillus endophyticus]|uniref:Protein nucleotidyltransferase YdiU n=1 Tax=Ureibacillus endophyticus TaxID=1978490 RepID=A0A494YYH4_9BACL|nr:YdiU family protein [Lysinibacillus endophyticus]RKQ15281.1 YdiU family protein [Lysinibacillus endophyticus]
MGIGWNFDNSYARLPNDFYAEIELNPVRAPKLVKLNKSLAKDLGLDVEELQSDKAIAILAGNTAPEGSKPIAQAYAGHQFGHFTMLGDGRAVLLGEQITPKEERFDIQLKGSGRTPFSRGGDGRAALGPMLREYIISEAMHALGIPTTRSLAVVTTGESIIRETELPGAVLTRVASSHLRVGTFQYAANMGSFENLEVLAHYAIIRHYEFIPNSETRYLRLLEEVIKRQADLIAKWQLVGFIHGVMNTDNMTISGETIDYGPCAFMDTYDPKTVFSSIDRHGRYAYENQPVIGGWNLARFAESLIPLIHEDPEQGIELAQNEISKYMPLYEESYQEGMRSKLGLFNEEEQDKELINELLDLMHKHRADYTNTFRGLTIGDMTDTPLSNKEEFKNWLEKWQARLSRQEQTKDEVRQLMESWNPVVIPRNHRVEEALEAAVNGDYSVMEKLLKVLANPYDYTSELTKEYCSLPAPSNLPYRTFCGT